MENNAPICPKCNGEMEEGFIPDITDAGVDQSRWAEGSPQPGFWGGTKLPKRRLLITTYRCMRCGYLESYAWQNSASPGS